MREPKNPLVRKVLSDELGRIARIASILDRVIHGVIEPTDVEGGRLFGHHHMGAKLDDESGTALIAEVIVDEYGEIRIEGALGARKFAINQPKEARQYLKNCMAAAKATA